MAHAVKLLACIRDMFSSNLGRGTDYPEWCFSWFFSVPLSRVVLYIWPRPVISTPIPVQYLSLLCYWVTDSGAGIAQSVWSLVTEWTTKRVWSSSSGRVKNFLFSLSSISALGPTKTPIQWVPVAFRLRGKAARAWSWPLWGGQEIVAPYSHSPHTPSWRRA
jgi:hypothetical protein